MRGEEKPMWYITQTVSGRAIAVYVRHLLFGSSLLLEEAITLQICGQSKPEPMTLSGEEWDQVVALVEADRTIRAVAVEKERIKREGEG